MWVSKYMSDESEDGSRPGEVSSFFPSFSFFFVGGVFPEERGVVVVGGGGVVCCCLIIVIVILQDFGPS